MRPLRSPVTACSVTCRATAPKVRGNLISLFDVSKYGADAEHAYLHVGDGVTDDTAAINAAITAGGRCGQGCVSHLDREALPVK